MAYIRTLRNACSKHPFNTLQQVLWQILNQRIKALETEIKKRLCTEHFKKIQLSGYASPHCTRRCDSKSAKVHKYLLYVKVLMFTLTKLPILLFDN